MSMLEAQTVARITSDELELDGEGRFVLTLGGEEAEAEAEGQWLALPPGANMVWVRQFFDDPAAADGHCAIVRLDPVAPPPIEAGRFTRRLANLGATLDIASKVISRGAGAADTANGVREWAEMQSGAVYTEPGIHYQRGAWKLAPGEALVIEGRAVQARHWSVLFYSRFLNSLDYNNRQISLTGPRIEQTM